MSMSERQSHPRRRVGAYGIDAPYVPVIFGVGGLVLLGIAGLNAAQGINPWAIITCALSGVWFLACAACYLHTTRAGKFAVWAEIIQGLQLRGAERVLDLGCGRGAVLLAIAKRLPHGQAIGIDLWKISDQSGNSMAMTRRNAVREGVATQVTLETADMRAPLRGRRVRCRGQQPGDPHHPRRGRAVEEAARVLKPGGRLVITDIRAAEQYRDELRQGAVTMRPLGWRFWYGGPWMAAQLVTATKPSSRAHAKGR